MVHEHLAQGSPWNLTKPLLSCSLLTEKRKDAWRRKAETLKEVEYKLRGAQVSSSAGSQDNNHLIVTAKFAQSLKQVQANI